MAKSPVFSAKRKSELLQSRSDQRSHFGRGLLDLVEKVLPRMFHRQEQKVAIASFDPFRRKPPKLAAEGGDVPVVQFGRETKPLKSQHQVVSPQNRLQIGGVGRKPPGGDLAHGVGILEFAQQEFLRSEEHTSELQSRFDLVCRLL